MSKDDRIAAYTEIFGPRAEALLASLRGASPEFTDHVYTRLLQVYQDDTLDIRTRLLCSITCLVTVGAPPQVLRCHIESALLHGTTKEQIAAALEVVGVYAGIAKAAGALMLLRDVLAEAAGDHGAG